MNIRRALATAVAAAVTAPVVILSAGPALADAKPAAQTQQKPTIAELEKAAAAAKKAYEDALATEKTAREAVAAATSDTAPLHVKAKAADKEAGTATAARTVADKAVSDAQFILDKLPADATAADRAAAEKVLADAKKDAETAAGVEKTAVEKAKAALKEAQDAEVAAFKALYRATEATKTALAAKEAADKALADAKKAAAEPTCEPGSLLVSTVLTGLPSQIAAGTSTDFSLRITNGTDKAIARLRPFTYVWAADKSHHKVSAGLLHLQWSTDRSGGWKDVDSLHRAGVVENLAAGAHTDVKLRLKLDAKTPAGQGFAFVAALNGEKPCDGSEPPMDKYPFEILAAGAKPGTGKARTTDTKPLGGTSTTAVNTTSSGQLAATGSSSATPKLALAGGAALVVGAGAVMAARRRRTDG
ncbi:LAETG motif-containing sortase-dependent surface protein [Streptomyces crystallinus]|uniref:Gram-positive cocci surface proteins LPxTG domain-containing protein n=1 Tax=Streptomyces crystallinus TaxID=68191 RepID=A0ABN1H095_9ACTN